MVIGNSIKLISHKTFYFSVRNPIASDMQNSIPYIIWSPIHESTWDIVNDLIFLSIREGIRL